MASAYSLLPLRSGWGVKKRNATRLSRIFPKRGEALRWAKRRALEVVEHGRDGMVLRKIDGNGRGPWRAGDSRKLLADAVVFRVQPAKYMPRDLRPVKCEFRLWWRVIIFPTKEALYAYADWRSAGRKEGEKFTGIVMPMHTVDYKPGGEGRLKSKLGEVLLDRAKLAAAVICHESIHVATSTLRCLDAPLDLGPEIGDAEERLSYMACGACRQIVDALYAAGCYDNAS